MNELLLVLLIAFTLMTFLSLNKKMGAVSGNVPPLPAIQPELAKTMVLYSSKEKDYSGLWTVTSIAGDAMQGMQDAKKEMTVIYHQLCKNEIRFPYHSNDDKKDLQQEVCVISSISDLHYRHVLLPADFKM